MIGVFKMQTSVIRIQNKLFNCRHIENLEILALNNQRKCENYRQNQDTDSVEQCFLFIEKSGEKQEEKRVGENQYATLHDGRTVNGIIVGNGVCDSKKQAAKDHLRMKFKISFSENPT